MTKTNDESVPQKKAGIMTKLYNWVISWADTPYGAPALFLLAVVESSVFPIPPDPLLGALGLGKPKRALFYGMLCTAGSVLGGAIGYLIGLYLFDTVGVWVIQMYGLAEKYDTIQALYDEYNAVVVLVAGISPIPYKVFTIAAGAFKVNFAIFIIASVVGRGFRFMTEAILITYYGDTIREFIDTRVELLSWGVAGLVIVGFVAIKFLM